MNTSVVECKWEVRVLGIYRYNLIGTYQLHTQRTSTINDFQLRGQGLGNQLSLAT